MSEENIIIRSNVVATRRWLIRIIAAFLALLLFFVWAVPRQRRLDERIDRLILAEEEAAKSRWPQDVAQLTEQLENAEEVLNGSDVFGSGVDEAARMTFQNATGYFRKCIEEKFTSVQDFMENASNLDYLDLLDRVRHECEGAGVNLSDASVQREGSSGSLPTYQKLAKLWSIQRLVQLVRESGLTVLHNPRGTARIYAARPHGYVLTENPDEVPFVMEVPVQIAVTGSHEQFVSFMGLLQSGDAFMPIRNLSIHSIPPEAGKDTVTRLKYTIWCTAFFPLE